MPLLGTRGAASARGFGFGGGANQLTPSSALNTWYDVPSGTSYWYVPLAATQVRIVIVGAGCDLSYSWSTSYGGGGGGCVDVTLTVNASNGILPNEQLRLVHNTSKGSEGGYVTSYVYRSLRDNTNAIGYARSGGPAQTGGTAGTSVSTGSGLTVSAYNGGTGGAPWINGAVFVVTGGGGGGAGPSGAGQNGYYAGPGGLGGAGNSALPGSSGGAGGDNVTAPFYVTTNGNPGKNYGGGCGGEGYGGATSAGSSFFRIYAS